MALYAIGDVQGCLACLERLLAKIDFQQGRDRLWFVGDLVNRGPESAGVMRRVRELGAEVVLGNHDLHLLAVAAGAHPVRPGDTYQDVLEAPDRVELLAWLASRPLLVRDDDARWIMVHAGLPPAWDVQTASRLAREAGALLEQHAADTDFLAAIYGDDPNQWHESLQGMARIRFIMNALTRLRFCDPAGRLALEHNGPPGSQPKGLHPWFELWPFTSHRVVFGHWSRLGAGDHGNAVSTDSGCVWGQRLSAARLTAAGVGFSSVSCCNKRL